MRDGFGNVPDQFGDMAALPILAADLQVNFCVVHVAGLCYRCDRANRCGLVKPLADTPRAALLFHLVLQVAARHVQTNRITKNVLVRIGCLNVFSAGANRHNQFNFVVQVFRQAGVGHRAGAARVHHHDGIGGFQKEKGRLATGEPHFFGVVFIVAAHAIDAANRKAIFGAHDGHANWGWRGDDKAHERDSLWVRFGV